MTRRTHLCLAGPEVVLDRTGIVPFGQRVHSVAFGPEAIVAIDTSDVRACPTGNCIWPRLRLPCGRRPKPRGLSGVSAAAGRRDRTVVHVTGCRKARGTPCGDASRQFLARSFGNLSRPRIGPQTAHRMQCSPGILSSARSPVGDMVGFAVAQHGPGVLHDPDADSWAALETEYKLALNDELFGDVARLIWLAMGACDRRDRHRSCTRFSAATNGQRKRRQGETAAGDRRTDRGIIRAMRVAAEAMSVVLTLGSATPRAPVVSLSIIETGPHPAIQGPDRAHSVPSTLQAGNRFW